MRPARWPAVLWIAPALTLALLAAATSIRQMERVPPIGWESRITPGFDPPIEYFIAYANDGFLSPMLQKREEVVKQWGPNALDVLKRLSEDPGWAAYRGDIQQLITLVESPETLALLVQEAEKQLDAPDTDRGASADLHGALARLATADYGAFTALLDARFATASKAKQQTFVYMLMYRLRGEHAADCEARLNEIAKTANDGAIQKTIADALAENAGYLRAQEPMRTVLDAERGQEQKP